MRSWSRTRAHCLRGRMERSWSPGWPLNAAPSQTLAACMLSLADNASHAARCVTVVLPLCYHIHARESNVEGALRSLIGLPDRPSHGLLEMAAAGTATAAAAGTAAETAVAESADGGGGHVQTGVHWLEALALQLACARAHLSQADAEMRMLPAFTRHLGSSTGRPFGDGAEVSRLAQLAAEAMERSRQAMHSGDLGAACSHATLASAQSRAAARHPSLLVVETATVPDDSLVTTWAPLFFPIATTVGSVVVGGVVKRVRWWRRRWR